LQTRTWEKHYFNSHTTLFNNISYLLHYEFLVCQSSSSFSLDCFIIQLKQKIVLLRRQFSSVIKLRYLFLNKKIWCHPCSSLISTILFSSQSDISRCHVWVLMVQNYADWLPSCPCPSHPHTLQAQYAQRTTLFCCCDFKSQCLYISGFKANNEWQISVDLWQSSFFVLKNRPIDVKNWMEKEVSGNLWISATSFSQMQFFPKKGIRLD